MAVKKKNIQFKSIIMFHFTKHNKYRRQEIWEKVKGKNVKMSNFQQTGYERIDEDYSLHS